ncbi:MAG: hypothetical protein CMF61_06270 [Magnetococcales bacterium]|nr:hypothetical protein [Magnetococcales bacterium]PPR19240.1 MAG: hypothetical protein CFH43_00290 [Pseudomonadota bacterium]|tara:strand:- start:741 stop:1103 length:363 start_codon:yes stop_codon:yes gene_type:complete
MATPIIKMDVIVSSFQALSSHRSLTGWIINCPQIGGSYVQIDRNVGVNPNAVDELVEKIREKPEGFCDAISEKAEELFATKAIEITSTEAKGFVEVMHEDEIQAELNNAFKEGEANVTFY